MNKSDCQNEGFLNSFPLSGHQLSLFSLSASSSLSVSTLVLSPVFLVIFQPFLPLLLSLSSFTSLLVPFLVSLSENMDTINTAAFCLLSVTADI